MPRKDAILSFNQMSTLSKIVFLNELKGVVKATNFSYHKGDEPYWWLGLRMDNGKILEKIEKMVNDYNDLLRYEVDTKQSEISKTM